MRRALTAPPARPGPGGGGGRFVGTRRRNFVPAAGFPKRLPRRRAPGSIRAAWKGSGGRAWHVPPRPPSAFAPAGYARPAPHPASHARARVSGPCRTHAPQPSRLCTHSLLEAAYTYLPSLFPPPLYKHICIFFFSHGILTLILERLPLQLLSPYLAYFPQQR